jgi:hypothetical protein
MMEGKTKTTESRQCSKKITIKNTCVCVNNTLCLLQGIFQLALSLVLPFTLLHLEGEGVSVMDISTPRKEGCYE